MPIDYPGVVTYPANVQIPADADPADGESVRLPMRQLADRTAFLSDALTPGPFVSRNLSFHPSVFRHFDEDGAPEDGSNPSTPRDGGPVVVTSSTLVLACPLNRLVPEGAALQRVDVLLELLTGTLPVGAQLRLIRTDHDFDGAVIGTPTVVASNVSPTTAGVQLLTLLGSPLTTMTESDAHHIALSQLAGSIRIHGLRVQFLDVRARNY